MRKSLITVVFGVLVTGCSQSEAPKEISDYNSHKNQQVIIVHGLARSASSMEEMSERVEEHGYQVCVVDYPTVGRELDYTLHKSGLQIDECVYQFDRELSQASGSKIHFVGHSLGGLVIRDYLAKKPAMTYSQHLGEVVFLGTPNHGSDVADFFSSLWLLPLAGGTAASLTTDPQSLPNSLPQPNYPFGVIAGTDTYPVLRHVFENSNDGLVSVESAQLEGMQDFIAVDIKHDSLRSDPMVTDLVLNYLSNRRFAVTEPAQ
ncbi:alpha/beta fold hydrolase [Vibrio breoganii]|uniref:esterase/lipase family protein n=2 Tax=Vibrio breoganii TaxID=553239 RepID=UPI0002DE9FBB|nr:alpha/beta fold hydrolase [Vibrio breoganii]OEF84677.1 lipase [Vibrio breoganii 1C10]PMH18247.1 lipase [Vibrio breoganii]PMK66415.1 lipase [Vibrio breoganii]PML56352.1 lipase [Vibrio breoganii]PMM12891.1 lipase [Vibrio breoganii]